ncbi:MAG: hypothetical protein IJQ97_02205 [Paludibacteraceae bacterium]|nr:hypothetical protein [Paludibacteraceae bacterium]
MNYSRLAQTRIPDLAPVYGGARGRTMSSRHQLYAWRALQEAGVTTVIDLREKDHSDRLPALCDEYGMQYFHYPVDTTAEAIAQMTELFPEFCRLIDAGNFYIACAMGLHRTDIALCAYWVFCGANKGIEPPTIRGYRKEDGHNTSKLMRILNAMYQAFMNYEGIAPMTESEFRQRKNIIQQQANQPN